jgi:hypothetical protein
MLEPRTINGELSVAVRAPSRQPRGPRGRRQGEEADAGPAAGKRRGGG